MAYRGLGRVVGSIVGVLGCRPVDSTESLSPSEREFFKRYFRSQGPPCVLPWNPPLQPQGLLNWDRNKSRPHLKQDSGFAQRTLLGGWKTFSRSQSSRLISRESARIEQTGQHPVIQLRLVLRESSHWTALDARGSIR